MNFFTLVLIPIGLGLVGSLTPCALGINALFLGYMLGKDLYTRLWQGIIIALARASSLMLLGLLFAFIGEQIKTFTFAYQRFMAWSLVALGVLFILSRSRVLPLPALHLGSKWFQGKSSALALGAAFGLDIPACTSPMVFALLAQTVLVGDLTFGAISLFIFGFSMSLPALLLALFGGAHRTLVQVGRRFRTPFYWGAGLLLIIAGLSELYPPVMAAVSIIFERLVGPILAFLPM